MDHRWRHIVLLCSVSETPFGPLVENGSDEVEAGSRGEQRGDPGRIVGRTHPDKIRADDLKPTGDLPQNVLAFVVAEATVTDRGRSRRDRWIEAVDVDRDINALPIGYVRNRGCDALGAKLAQGDDVRAAGLRGSPIFPTNRGHIVRSQRGDSLHMLHFGRPSRWAAVAPTVAVTS